MNIGWLHTGYEPIGVDVGTWGVKLLQLRRSRGAWEVVAAARRPFESPRPDDPDRRRAWLSSAIVRALDDGGFHGAACVSCLLPSEIMLRAVRLPRMSDVELGKAAVWEATDRLDLEPGTFESDWIRAGKVVQGDNIRDEVIVIAASSTDISAHVEALIDAGLTPLALETPYTAVARTYTRTLRRESDRGVVQMMVDVGAGGTSVMLTRGQRIVFVKRLTVGGEALKSAIIDLLSIEPDVAAQVRIQRLSGTAEGAGDEGAPEQRYRRAVYEAVRPRLHELGREVALCLRYYSVTFRSARPSQVLLCGGECGEPHLNEILSEHLKIDCEYARPFEGIEIAPDCLGGCERRGARLSEWSAAAGLSFRGHESGSVRSAASKAVAEARTPSQTPDGAA